MKNTTDFIRNLILAIIILSVSAITTLHAAPVVRSVASENDFVVAGTISQFFGDIGGADNGVGGSFTTGRRVIDWDVIPNNQLMENSLITPDYFNTISPRGMVLSAACTDDRFKVSANNQSAQPPRFGNLNPNYANSFQDFTGVRLFSADVGGCNFIDVYFYVPGTRIPATIGSFGVVFTDVDMPFASGIRAYGIDGKPLGGLIAAPPFNNGLSFVGATYTGGERIAHVRIYSGSARLGESDSPLDVAVMDDFYFGEPRAIGQHANDFDGDGTSDYAVFRPSNGTWYVMNSGSNTFSGTQFGAAGDVPVDDDFDGDSRNDLAVFRPSSGAWYILRSSSGQFQGTTFGQTDDKPVAGDYDRDGKSDIAVWRPSTGTYYYLKSSNGQFSAVAFGKNGDVPIGSSIQ